MKVEFIVSKARSDLEAVVYPSALGNILVCLQQLELQREREGGESLYSLVPVQRVWGEKRKQEGQRKKRCGQGLENASICLEDCVS